MRTGLVDVVQVIYNIFDQSPEDELFPVCQELNVGVIARVPFDEGSLGGKMTLETRFPKDDWRSGYFGPENLAKTIKRVDKLKEILPAGMTLPEMALRFILSHPAVGTTIAGMRKLDHVRQNIAAGDAGPLDKALLAELKKHRWDRTPQQLVGLSCALAESRSDAIDGPAHWCRLSAHSGPVPQERPRCSIETSHDPLPTISGSSASPRAKLRWSDPKSLPTQSET